MSTSESKGSKSVTPVHDCPIMGKDTEYVSTLNIKTNKRGWICVWCEIANHVLARDSKPMPCSSCNGTGKLVYSNTGIENDCMDCNGSGIVTVVSKDKDLGGEK